MALAAGSVPVTGSSHHSIREEVGQDEGEGEDEKAKTKTKTGKKKTSDKDSAHNS